MSKKKRFTSSDAVAMRWLGAAAITCIIWTCLTGALWPWIPVIGGTAVTLAVVRAMNSDRTE